MRNTTTCVKLRALIYNSKMVCKIDSEELTKKVELSGKCYEHGPALDKQDFVRALCPDTADTIIDKLVTATEKYAFGMVEGVYNEYCLFRRQYERICQVALRESGFTAFELYRLYKPVVEAAVLKLLTEVTGDVFYGGRATESSDNFIIRQIQMDTFGLATTPLQPRTFTIGSTSVDTGNPFHLIPRKDVSADTDVYTTTPKEQMLLIFYYQSDLGPRVLESISEYINDNLTWRTPFGIYSQLQRGNMGIAQRPGCLIVGSNQKLDINAWCLETGDTDIMPQGIEICKRKNIQELKS